MVFERLADVPGCKREELLYCRKGMKKACPHFGFVPK